MASKEELEAMGIQRNNDTNGDYRIKNNSNNKIAMILRVVAIIEIVCGFILGCVLGDTFGIGYYGYDFNWGLCIGIIIAGFISGIFILGFAEIIQLLQDIKNSAYKNEMIEDDSIPKL